MISFFKKSLRLLDRQIKERTIGWNIPELTEGNEYEALLCWAGDCYKYGVRVPKSIYKAGFYYYLAMLMNSELGKIKLDRLKGNRDLKDEITRLRRDRYRSGAPIRFDKSYEDYNMYINRYLLAISRFKKN